MGFFKTLGSNKKEDTPANKSVGPSHKIASVHTGVLGVHENSYTDYDPHKPVRGPFHRSPQFKFGVFIAGAVLLAIAIVLVTEAIVIETEFPVHIVLAVAGAFLLGFLAGMVLLNYLNTRHARTDGRLQFGDLKVGHDNLAHEVSDEAKAQFDDSQQNLHLH